MPLTFHRNIVERARILYTQEGRSPKEIIDELEQAVAAGSLKMPGTKDEDIVLPRYPSTIYRWAERGEWQPHWREARKKKEKAIAEGVAFAVSGITDPIWHLSRVLAQRRLVNTLWVRQGQSGWTDKDVIYGVIRTVMQQLNPGPGVLRELRPFIRRELKRLCKPGELEKAQGDYSEEDTRSQLFVDFERIDTEAERQPWEQRTRRDET